MTRLGDASQCALSERKLNPQSGWECPLSWENLTPALLTHLLTASADRVVLTFLAASAALAGVTAQTRPMNCTLLTWLARSIIAALVLSALWLAQATEKRQESRPQALRAGEALQAAATPASGGTRQD